MMESKGGRFGASLLVPSVHLIKVPSRYIRDDQESHVIPSSMPPIIDMERLTSQDSDDSELEKLHLACKDWGFFQIINHGIYGSLLEEVKKETQEFFKLPIEVKKKFWRMLRDLDMPLFVSEEQKQNGLVEYCNRKYIFSL